MASRIPHRPRVTPNYDPPVSVLHMYENVEVFPEIALEEFQDVALERLRLLRLIERAPMKESRPFAEEQKEFLRDKIKEEGLRGFFTVVGLPGGKSEREARRDDHLSHFILRLAYCKDEERRKWLLRREIDMFTLKYFCATDEQRRAVVDRYFGYLEPITFLEKLELHDKLSECTSDVDIDETDFYEVPFRMACTSVTKRNVYMSRGFVYLPATSIIELLQHRYRKKLQNYLSEMCNCLPMVRNDKRIQDVLDNLHTASFIRRNSFKGNNDETQIQDLETYAKHNFPLCMQHLHKELSEKGHLKHQARLQYGLFLKDCGFHYEEVFEIFREHFCKNISEDRFVKKYSYGIKYMYGLVGRMREQNGQDCEKIIGKSVACGQEHGCPYQHWDDDSLKGKLREKGLSVVDIEDILSLKEQNRFQNACTRFFDYTHSEQLSKVVSHPNEYFEESRRKGGLLEVLRSRLHELEADD